MTAERGCSSAVVRRARAAGAARRRPRAARRLLAGAAQRRRELTLAQMQRAPGRLAGAAGRAARAGQRAPARRRARAARAPGGAARLPGGDQQVGLLVRAVPRGVRRLPARLGRRWDARWRSSASTRATRAAPKRSRFLRSFPVELPELLRPAAGSSARRSPTRVHARDRLLRPRTAGAYIHQGPYPSVAKLEARRPALRAGRLERCPRSASTR